ncbi:hypothetical protein Cgig2_029203 [Carnegiea gigantea]|uniref:Uncharacterized protein n=1 Tax=Carnegiea gigantea TaxID=171969 RepID=A0A9Q1KK80_9CARY|nr:hypothetical protein Cgig2_029203 [Carnegiea gigantea]
MPKEERIKSITIHSKTLKPSSIGNQLRWLEYELQGISDCTNLPKPNKLSQQDAVGENDTNFQLGSFWIQANFTQSNKSQLLCAGVYDFYVDIPQQKITTIGCAHPERIIKAIKEVRNSQPSVPTQKHQTLTVSHHQPPPPHLQMVGHRGQDWEVVY